MKHLNIFINEIKTFSKWNKEKKQPYEYGCLMLKIDEKWSDLLPFELEPDDVYEPDSERYGIEKKPHVTILYGFHKEVKLKDIKEWCEKNVKDPISITLNKIDAFYQDDYDVLKFNIRSKKLHELNKKLRRKFPYTNDFPDYKPHCTIMYCKPGTAKKYFDKIDSIKLECNTLMWSQANGETKYIDIQQDEKDKKD